MTGNDADLVQRVRELRFHGSKDKRTFTHIGFNSRLDEVQAAILRLELEVVDAWNARRAQVAAWYDAHLPREVLRPCVPDDRTHVYHLYMMRHPARDAIAAACKERQVDCAAYYVTPCHLQPVFADFGHKLGDFPVTDAAAETNLALPMHPNLTEEQVKEVAAAVAAGLRVERGAGVARADGGARAARQAPSAPPANEERVRVWVDITDSSHVLFFAPVVRRLEDQGHVVTLTARRFESAELTMRRLGLVAVLTGQHRGGGPGARAVGLVNRTAQLLASASSGRFDVAVGSHASDFVLTAWALGVPQLTLLDDERLQRTNAVNVRLVDRAAVPDAIPVGTLRALGVMPEKLFRYPGFKEEYYLHDFSGLIPTCSPTSTSTGAPSSVSCARRATSETSTSTPAGGRSARCRRPQASRRRPPQPPAHRSASSRPSSASSPSGATSRSSSCQGPTSSGATSPRSACGTSSSPRVRSTA